MDQKTETEATAIGQRPRRAHFTCDALSPALADRLVKLCGMSDANSDGEALNAIRLANKLLKDNKTTWREALTPALPAPEPPPKPKPDRNIDWQTAARVCVQFGQYGVLTPWEVDFCRGLHRFTRLSAKQAAVLQRCYLKVFA